jgi:hypothetical protein
MLFNLLGNDRVYMYMHVDVYVCMYICMYIYIYTRANAAAVGGAARARPGNDTRTTPTLFLRRDVWARHLRGQPGKALGGAAGRPSEKSLY